LSGLLAGSLGAALALLNERLDAVSWPQTTSANSSAGSSTGSSPDSPAGKTTGAAAGWFGALDLAARTTLAPGTYTLDYMAGESASGGAGGRTLIRIYGTDTWQDVLLRLARALGTASPGMFSRLVPVSAGAISAPPKALGRALCDGVAAVLDSCNEVGGLLGRQSGGLGPGAAAEWTGAAAQRTAALRAVGVERAGTDLWLSAPEFLAALWSDPQKTQAALCGPDGFFTALRAQAAEVAAASSLAQAPAAACTPDLLAGPGMAGSDMAGSGKTGTPRTESQAERASRLLDVYDGADGSTGFSLDGLGVGGSGGLVSRRG